MKTIQAHEEIGRFTYWFNLLSQKVYRGGRLEPLRGDAVADGKIGEYAYAEDGSWVELPALTIDYHNGHAPFGSKAFTAFGYDFYLFRGINCPEAKEVKREGTFRVNNDKRYLAEQVAIAWRKLGGTAKLGKDPNALVCVGSGGVWVSLYE